MSYPPELEGLIPLDDISLNQHIKKSGLFRGLKPNCYSVLKTNGEFLYSTAKTPLPASTMFLPFHDINGREIMRVTRPQKEASLLIQSLRSNNWIMAIVPELEALIPLSGIYLNQHIEGWGILSGLHPNRYSVLDPNRKPLYAVEEIPLRNSTMFYGGINRSYELPFYDINGREIMRVIRPFAIINREVELMVGNKKLGSIKNDIWSFMQKFNVLDGLGRNMLQINPVLRCSNDDYFRISALNGLQIGGIEWKCQGFTKAGIVGADKFSVSFPIDLHVNLKALLIAAAIHVDFTFYEGKR